jgi:hypothetical protein
MRPILHILNPIHILPLYRFNINLSIFHLRAYRSSPVCPVWSPLFYFVTHVGDFVFPPMLPHVPYGLRWGTHEAQLRCPHEVDGDMWICSTKRALKPKFY